MPIGHAAVGPGSTRPSRDHPRASQVRLSEVAGALSLAGDLAMGQPVEHGLRAALLAVRIAAAAGCGVDDIDAAYWTVLLRWSGCTANAHDFARLLGDDVAGRAALQETEPAERASMVARLAGPAMASLPDAGEVFHALTAAHCEVAQQISQQFGLPATVTAALGQVFERHDGQGGPNGLTGAEISLPAQIAVLAGDVEILHRIAGVDGLGVRLQSRAGSLYDPTLADLALAGVSGWLVELEAARRDHWRTTMAAEPVVRAPLAARELDAALGAVADFVDLKVPFLAGHSRAVAALAERAGQRLGLSPEDTVGVRRAGLLHDLGRVAVPNSIWESGQPLSRWEADTARLHPRHTERCLAHVAGLAAEAHLASMHHERLDGSGYHREMSAVGLPLAARVLAAADCWVAMTSERPYRAALAPHDATAALRQEAALGRLDPQVVDAILAVSGQHQRPRGGTWPAGLSDREVDVLRLAMRGLTNPDIAARLSISPKTVGNHLQHVYAKLGVGTRAAATFTAMRLGLAADDHG